MGRGIRARLGGKGGALSQQRLDNSGFDFCHDGVGSALRDPRPLLWSDEPGVAAAVTSILDNGAAEVVINIRSSRTHSVDGELRVQLKKFGFDFGGTTQTSSASSLSIRASFPQGRRGRT